MVQSEKSHGNMKILTPKRGVVDLECQASEYKQSDILISTSIDEGRGAFTQVLLISFVCFCCPGMWNSITGMIDSILDERSEVASDATAVIYGCFAVSSFIAPAINNLAGPRITLFIGTLGYLAYVLSLLNFRANATDTNEALVLAAAALNGICAALLWTAQGQLCMAYPTDSKRGLYLGIFWIIFNFGGVVGGLISLITNLNAADTATSQNITTIYIFAGIMAFGTVLTLFLANPRDVRRSDGTRIVMAVESQSDWRNEASSILKLATNKTMLMLLPLFLYSNWFYAYQFGPFQSIFDPKTQGFTNLFYWAAQMIGAYFIGRYLDEPSMSIKRKAVTSFVGFTLWTVAVWAFTTWAHIERRVDAIQGSSVVGPNSAYNAYNDSSSPLYIKRLEFYQASEFVPLFALYFCSGLADAFVQNWSYWLMGNLTQDVGKLGQYAGFYKGIQAAGGAISWKINGSKVPGLWQIGINVALFVVCLGPALAVANTLPDVALGGISGGGGGGGGDGGLKGAEVKVGGKGGGGQGEEEGDEQKERA